MAIETYQSLVCFKNYQIYIKEIQTSTLSKHRPSGTKKKNSDNVAQPKTHVDKEEAKKREGYEII